MMLVKQPKLKPSTARFVFIHDISGGTTEELQKTQLYAQELLLRSLPHMQKLNERAHRQGNISLKGFCRLTFFVRKTTPSRCNFATSHWYRASHSMFGEAQLCSSARGLFLAMRHQQWIGC
ncbi:hypothetical protein FVEG_02987 [Fusarium verticillioides 7600]|uniref:Uncharacterized protein n=1 Tax=Gibberella moniliformis (strain M3125 / FGSC 7600) TaxID=334819 RepID=W7LQ67_GIBM7|nr:hypothetical protein FVEG_02987 [Fusarium verticillioides 7600]EWG40681.1 hypothetical protein FVEG_02987 [Fusarium verticillioides 7600]